jgi:hypothetical protein
MPTAVSSTLALPQRRLVRSKGAGTEHWCTDFIGRHAHGESTNGPETFLIEMSPHETILPHYHEVDQFQVFLAGAGRFGRKAAPPLAVHYVDRYTGYGPIRATGHGYSYFVMHAEKDPGAVYRNRPGYRERIKPGRKRHLLVPGVAISTTPVLLSRREAALEPLFSPDDGDDGLGAFMWRIGPETAATGPDPAESSGQFYLVVNGSLELNGMTYPAWSPIYVAPGERALEVRAGGEGLEALVLQFPRRKGENLI